MEASQNSPVGAEGPVARAAARASGPGPRTGPGEASPAGSGEQGGPVQWEVPWTTGRGPSHAAKPSGTQMLTQRPGGAAADCAVAACAGKRRRVSCRLPAPGQQLAGLSSRTCRPTAE
eukprot:9417826-Pyramimonas_sp.AAC.1